MYKTAGSIEPKQNDLTLKLPDGKNMIRSTSTVRKGDKAASHIRTKRGNYSTAKRAEVQ